MINIATWNSQGIKSNIPWLSNLVPATDVIALQETWLFQFESNILKISDDYSVLAQSGMKPSSKIRGRPYGGVAFLIKTELFKSIKTMDINDTRIIGFKLPVNDIEIMFLNVYFPVNQSSNLQMITEYIGRISSLVTDHSGPSIIVGDFNMGRHHSNFVELSAFCNDHDSIILDAVKLRPETYTYVSKCTGTTSWIDHVIVSKSISELVVDMSTPFMTSPSDHIPICFKLKVSVSSDTPKTVVVEKYKSVKWRKVSHQNKISYNIGTRENLNRLSSWKLCYKSNCQDILHKTSISDYYSLLVASLSSAQKSLIVKAEKVNNKKQGVIGWNTHVKSKYIAYKDAYKVWLSSSRSNSDMFQNMCNKRKEFKKALKHIQKSKERLLADHLAAQYKENNFYKFWARVKQCESKSDITTNTLNGFAGDEQICEMWAKHYGTMFHNESFSKHVCGFACNKQPELNITDDVIAVCIQRLKMGKASGPDGLSAESLKYADSLINSVIANLFTSCLAHAYLPRELMNVTLVPILKRNGLDQSVLKNYRPIALANILSKVLELVILCFNSYQLTTNHNQFGYKKGVGTETAVFCVKQIAHHYLRRGSHVYLCYLDATAAFDNVNHELLLQKLCSRGFNHDFIRLLEYWFNNQFFLCRWKHVLSSNFPVRRGIRQGGVLSAHFWSVYSDELAVQLEATGLGCRAGRRTFNACFYADDVVLMTTTLSAMRKLLNLCENYGRDNHIFFNPSKTFLQCFVPKAVDNVRPLLKFCGKTIQCTDTVKYLGYEMNCGERDVLEIARRKRDIYATANMLANRFRRCSKSVKKYLFLTYLSNIYCSSLWCPVLDKTLQSARVAYNDAARIFFGYKRQHSASQMFAELNLPDFQAMRRTGAYSLVTRLAKTDNPILKIFSTPRFF